MDIGATLGSFFGFKRIQDIPQGFATFLAATIVVIGWWQSARRERRAYQLENAHDHVLQKNARVMELMPKLQEYLRSKTPFPRFETIETIPDGPAIHKALTGVLNELELLAIDAAVGRAYEMYIIETQRTLISNFFILARDYIESHRRARSHRSVYRNLERFFVRIYINRFSPIEKIVEFILGRPVFRYTYFSFQAKYIIVSFLFGLNPNFREEDWPRIRVAMKRLRIIGLSAVALACAMVLLSYLVQNAFELRGA